MNLLILHLQNLFQALQVLLNVFIWRQSLLVTADKVSLEPFLKDFSSYKRQSSHSDVLDYVGQHLPLSAHRCSGEELLQIAWLGL